MFVACVVLYEMSQEIAPVELHLSAAAPATLPRHFLVAHVVERTRRNPEHRRGLVHIVEAERVDAVGLLLTGRHRRSIDYGWRELVCDAVS